MLRRLCLSLFAIAACRPDTPAPPKPDGVAATSTPSASASAKAPSAGATVRGTIESIRLQDINKAAGHHTYNVELMVRHAAIEGPLAVSREAIPPVVAVRVDKVYFDDLTEAQRSELAPDGPKAELSPKRFRAYAVGAEVTLPVTFTSPGLASLRAP